MSNALEYARRFISFWQDSPISGRFDDAKYPFVREPLLSMSNIRAKTTVLYGPVQSLKSVILQIGTCYVVDYLRASALFIAQTDDDAKEFAEIKLNPMMDRVWAIKNTLRNQKYAQTLMKWLWANHSLLISGPSESAQQSKSARFVITDEAHLWSRDQPGAMDAFDDRHSSFWNGHSFHGTTAGDVGSDIDKRYYMGRQNEWHMRCVHCNGMIWPLFEDASKKEYNGHRVFQWREDESETALIDSIHMVCPHCDKQILDTPHNRIEMDDGAKYIAKNPGADETIDSFRFNSFAPRWKSWRELFKIYLAAIQSAKLGNFEPFWNWKKKQLVESNDYEIPMLGTSNASNFTLADIVEDASKYRVVSFDAQQGAGDEGRHFWGGCLECDPEGNVRVIAWQKCVTRGDCLAFVERYKPSQIVMNGKQTSVRDVAIDFGDDQDRTIRGMCAALKWLALKSGDEESFSHTIFPTDRRQKPYTIQLPYSERYIESSLAGKQKGELQIKRGQPLPEGCAIAQQWSKPAIYSIAYRLINGLVPGRKFEVPRDIDAQFQEGIHAYRPGFITDKQTRTTRKEIWIKSKQFDHPFVVVAQCMLQLITAGKYKLGTETVV